MLVTDHIYLVTHSQVFLMPFYHKTEGQPSNSLHVQTLADVPSAPPGNVRADVLNATAVELKWSPPPPQVRFHRSREMPENSTPARDYTTEL